MLTSTHRLIAVSLILLCISSPLIAQQRRGVPPRRPAPAEIPEPPATYDTLLAADSYKVYCEIRAVGGLIRSSAVNDLIDPVMKLGGPPKEFKTLVKWLNAHAEVLAGSRMLVAGWPSRPKLPAILVAIEFSSPEEAKKFYPELSGFLPTLLPTPTPTPSPTPVTVPKSTSVVGPGDSRMTAADPKLVTPKPVSAKDPGQEETFAEKESAGLPPYHMKQSGALVLISNTDFTFRDLRPRGAKLLEEDPNFTLARNRFSSESIFLYVDVKSIEKEEKDRQKKWEEEEKKRVEAEAATPPKAEESPETEINASSVEEQLPPPPPEPDQSPSSQPILVAATAEPQAANDATLSSAPQRNTDAVGPMMFSLYGALFGGQAKWPEAVSAALAFEGDTYVLRTLIVNGDENKSNPIPFVPQFVSGPALVPESPNIFPADMDLFVSVSLDYPQVYDGMLKAIANAEQQSRKFSRQTVKDSPPPESPFAAYEKKLGLKIKDDVLPLLGNELALVLPRKAKKASNEAARNPGNEGPTAGTNQADTNIAGPNPVIAISVKDREAVGRLIPKIIEGFGLKGANLLAQTEKREGTEITSYANLFAYAFVGDFLVVSPDAAATRHVVDAYINHQTLSSDSHFRNFTRWQPRQVLGQVYVAPGLVEQYTAAGNSSPVNEKMSEFLTRVNPVIDPLTYALSNDGLGPLHELHVPKNLLQLFIAGISSEAGKAPPETNEAMARSALQSVAVVEASFQADKGKGRYATLDELLSEGLISKEFMERYGYTIELRVSGNRFEATAVPNEYGKTGRLSFFIDESGVLRAGDHGGGAATAADQPMQ
ncbi:MAG TPA: DUF3352 domain-containing protein [Pyrinomonadaceae bacterium]|jgi:hypothetical protein